MSVRVVARIRPLLEKETDRDIIVRADRVDEGKPLTIVKIPSPKNEAEEFSFAFNGVYDQPTTQEELFTAEGKPARRDAAHGDTRETIADREQSRRTSRRSSRAWM